MSCGIGLLGFRLCKKKSFVIIFAALALLAFASTPAQGISCIKLYSLNNIMGPGCQTPSGEISTDADYAIVCSAKGRDSLQNYLSIIRTNCGGEGASFATEIIEGCNFMPKVRKNSLKDTFRFANKQQVTHSLNFPLILNFFFFSFHKNSLNQKLNNL
jgi:hypothetical protein